MPPATPSPDSKAHALEVAHGVVDAAQPFDPKGFVASLPARPGVYRMLDAAGQILYVGKAGNLKARVGSYFRADLLQPKVLAMVQQIAAIEVTVTSSDTEALLLEFNLIKKHRPRYNILLRDDKSFPYLYLTTEQEFPRLSFYRGSRNRPGRFFGPYPSTTAVRETLLQLQKLFRLRQCEDSYFENRTRPCLQYQIHRCSAPCVGLVSKADYAADVTAATRVLEGRNDEVATELAARMEEEAAALRFEKAAALRDQLAALKSVQARQIVSADSDVDCDVVAAATGPGLYCIGLMFIRAGVNLGTTTYFARAPFGEAEDVEAAFLAQHYLAHEAPGEIVVGSTLAEPEVIAAALGEHARHRVVIHRAERGLKARWVEMTRDNAVQALKMRLATEAGIEAQLEALGAILGLAQAPARLECFDISHTRGEATVASCVVFGREGAQKSDYRRFNLEGLTPGDDYGAMRQALTRRYKRIKAGEGKRPDVLLIDGGPGQLHEAAKVLAELEVAVPCVVGVAKGPDRRVGQERLFLLGSEAPLILPPDSRALHLIQRIRDEAHRFAIAGHRARRAKARQASVLEEVPGLGPARRRELLKRFGGLHGVLGAGVEDLARVRGIGRRLAAAIYERLHPDA
ncbi:MAG TPA: excinuclease ABC subunit UvrC [Steroidobacteraceae bacterium]|nr:excinuclease ABC subunit UvrC [Steroidobacteraceae bacterium]